ncbi:hypothetical protein [Streptomyces silvisoli]|uniref:Uncharacterized protein n=1 Tax=Streptomyces silvisoli TaxID=3034235 RepID=A0ABT5ZQ35_9ACTN|nr:hypothetical protein [Streptomyces silvisoli]MDF3291928.1 hypothetical protein [Streptomyces silvisoli]
MRAGADLRLLRAAVFSAVCVTLSAMGHAMASRAGVSLWALVAGWAGVLCAVGPLAGRERSLPGIAATLLAGELGLHLLFCLGQGYSMAVPPKRPDGVVALAERLICDARPTYLTPQSAIRIVRQAGIDPTKVMGSVHGMPGMTGMAGHGAHVMSLAAMFTVPMLAAHLVAAVVAGWVLRRGEAALWRVVRLPGVVAEHLSVLLPLVGLLTVVRALALVASLLERCSAALGRPAVRCGAKRLRAVVLRHVVIRRGPPVVALAV